MIKKPFHLLNFSSIIYFALRVNMNYRAYIFEVTYRMSNEFTSGVYKIFMKLNGAGQLGSYIIMR